MASSKNFENDIALIHELAKVLDETGLTDIEIERNGVKIKVGKSAAAIAPSAPPPASPTPLAPAPAPATSLAPAENHPGTVKSPMVGTAYMAPSPGSAAFVSVGDQVSEGQTLLIIEAMKTMNEIKAPHAGKIIDIIAKDAEPVEFGEALMIIN